MADSEKPKTAEERVEIVNSGAVRPYRVSLCGERVNDFYHEKNAEKLQQAIIAALELMRADTEKHTVNECCRLVREKCHEQSDEQKSCDLCDEIVDFLRSGTGVKSC